MTRRFVISAMEISTEDEKNFIEYLRTNRLGWWHWLNNFWLIVDKHDNITAANLRDELKKYSGFRRGIVMQVEKVTWAGFRDDPKMFDWVKSTWMQDD